MASWKKVLVSGSAGEFSSVTASVGLRVGNNQTISTTQAILTGSFTGSFTGNGSGLTGVTTTFPTVQKQTLAADDQFFIKDVAGGNVSKYITYDDVLDQLADKDTGTATNVGNIIKNTTTLALATEMGGFNSISSLVFTGSTATPGAVSFVGTASWANNVVTASYVTGSVFTSANPALSASYALTASYALNSVGGTLSISASNNTNTSIVLKDEALLISGTANQIAVNIDNANNLLQIGLPNNVIIPGNLSVTGTTTTVSASSLVVTDKFILLASSSTTVASDGGIIVQNTVTNNTGSGYGFIMDGASLTAVGSPTPRWGVTSSLSPTAANTTTPDEYMVTVKTTAGTQTAASTAPTYGGGSPMGNGNMIVDGAGDIWIYVY
jgi:hypothetical protein